MSEEELICGDVCGHFKTLYTRINKITVQALFCVGDFFGENGEEFEKICADPSTIPIMTYVLCPATSTALRFITDLNGCELCPFIKYLGQQGTYTTISGLRIVYVSVSPRVEADSDTWVTEFPSLEADPSFSGVDLLLTCQWPTCIVPSNDTLSSKVADQASLCVAHIARSVTPRYHFVATNGVFYERKPYRNHRVLQEKEKLVTRFIALAKVGNKGNAKYLYALKVKPVDKMSQIELCAQPPDVTDNPYFDTLDRTAVPKPKESEVQTEQYFYATGKKRAVADDDGDRRRTNWKLKKYDKPHSTESTHKGHDACWFCLGNPQVAKHLLVTIATHAYVALPRGPLVKDHVLILTVGHHQSWLACPEVVQADIEAYKKSLRGMFREEGKVMVTFERNYKTHHYQLQVVPVPFPVAGEVKKAFLEIWSRCPGPRQSATSASQVSPTSTLNFRQAKKLFNKIERDRVSSSDVNFGRAVLASEAILNCPERVNWRECTESEEVETQLAAEIRAKFAAFDFA
ncbi:CWF19-like protein 1 [Taenia crassiceps]|uniref:CWF19-like protein 1 n=1 Tax=Taenia crassiceps TaxID=6207 RepID=A0ABR4QRF2_9CEST